MPKKPRSSGVGIAFSHGRACRVRCRGQRRELARQRDRDSARSRCRSACGLRGLARLEAAQTPKGIRAAQVVARGQAAEARRAEGAAEVAVAIWNAMAMPSVSAMPLRPERRARAAADRSSARVGRRARLGAAPAAHREGEWQTPSSTAARQRRAVGGAARADEGSRGSPASLCGVRSPPRYGRNEHGAGARLVVVELGEQLRLVAAGELGSHQRRRPRRQHHAHLVPACPAPRGRRRAPPCSGLGAEAGRR